MGRFMASYWTDNPLYIFSPHHPHPLPPLWAYYSTELPTDYYQHLSLSSYLLSRSLTLQNIQNIFTPERTLEYLFMTSSLSDVIWFLNETGNNLEAIFVSVLVDYHKKKIFRSSPKNKARLFLPFHLSSVHLFHKLFNIQLNNFIEFNQEPDLVSDWLHKLFVTSSVSGVDLVSFSIKRVLVVVAMTTFSEESIKCSCYGEENNVCRVCSCLRKQNCCFCFQSSSLSSLCQYCKNNISEGFPWKQTFTTQPKNNYCDNYHYGNNNHNFYTEPSYFYKKFIKQYSNCVYCLIFNNDSLPSNHNHQSNNNTNTKNKHCCCCCWLNLNLPINNTLQRKKSLELPSLGEKFPVSLPHIFLPQPLIEDQELSDSLKTELEQRLILNKCFLFAVMIFQSTNHLSELINQYSRDLTILSTKIKKKLPTEKLEKFLKEKRLEMNNESKETKNKDNEEEKEKINNDFKEEKKSRHFMIIYSLFRDFCSLFWFLYNRDKLIELKKRKTENSISMMNDTKTSSFSSLWKPLCQQLTSVSKHLLQFSTLVTNEKKYKNTLHRFIINNLREINDVNFIYIDVKELSNDNKTAYDRLPGKKKSIDKDQPWKRGILGYQEKVDMSTMFNKSILVDFIEEEEKKNEEEEEDEEEEEEKKEKNNKNQKDNKEKKPEIDNLKSSLSEILSHNNSKTLKINSNIKKEKVGSRPFEMETDYFLFLESFFQTMESIKNNSNKITDIKINKNNFYKIRKNEMEKIKITPNKSLNEIIQQQEQRLTSEQNPLPKQQQQQQKNINKNSKLSQLSKMNQRQKTQTNEEINKNNNNNNNVDSDNDSIYNNKNDEININNNNNNDIDYDKNKKIENDIINNNSNNTLIDYKNRPYLNDFGAKEMNREEIMGSYLTENLNFGEKRENEEKLAFYLKQWVEEMNKKYIKQRNNNFNIINKINDVSLKKNNKNEKNIRKENNEKKQEKKKIFKITPKSIMYSLWQLDRPKEMMPDDDNDICVINTETQYNCCIEELEESGEGFLMDLNTDHQDLEMIKMNDMASQFDNQIMKTKPEKMNKEIQTYYDCCCGDKDVENSRRVLYNGEIDEVSNEMEKQIIEKEKTTETITICQDSFTTITKSEKFTQTEIKILERTTSPNLIETKNKKIGMENNFDYPDNKQMDFNQEMKMILEAQNHGLLSMIENMNKTSEEDEFYCLHSMDANPFQELNTPPLHPFQPSLPKPPSYPLYCLNEVQYDRCSHKNKNSILCGNIPNNNCNNNKNNNIYNNQNNNITKNIINNKNNIINIKKNINNKYNKYNENNNNDKNLKCKEAEFGKDRKEDIKSIQQLKVEIIKLKTIINSIDKESSQTIKDLLYGNNFTKDTRGRSNNNNHNNVMNNNNNNDNDNDNNNNNNNNNNYIFYIMKKNIKTINNNNKNINYKISLMERIIINFLNKNKNSNSKKPVLAKIDCNKAAALGQGYPKCGNLNKPPYQYKKKKIRSCKSLKPQSRPSLQSLVPPSKNISATTGSSILSVNVPKSVFKKKEIIEHKGFQVISDRSMPASVLVKRPDKNSINLKFPRKVGSIPSNTELRPLACLDTPYLPSRDLAFLLNCGLVKYKIKPKKCPPIPTDTEPRDCIPKDPKEKNIKVCPSEEKIPEKKKECPNIEEEEEEEEEDDDDDEKLEEPVKKETETETKKSEEKPKSCVCIKKKKEEYMF